MSVGANTFPSKHVRRKNLEPYTPPQSFLALLLVLIVALISSPQALRIVAREEEDGGRGGGGGRGEGRQVFESPDQPKCFQNAPETFCSTGSTVTKPTGVGTNTNVEGIHPRGTPAEKM